MWHISISMYVQQSFGCVAHVEQEGGRDMRNGRGIRNVKILKLKLKTELRRPDAAVSFVIVWKHNNINVHETRALTRR